MRAISYFKKKDIFPRRIARRDYYNTKEKKKKKWLFFVIVFLIVLSFSIYFFIFSPICKIKLISEIEDYELLRLSTQELEAIIKEISWQKYLFFIPADSLFLFPTKKLEKKLKDDKRVSDFKIKKIAPNILKIWIKVYEPKALLLNFDKKTYLLNQDGNIISFATTQPILPLIENKVEQIKNFGSPIKFIDEISKNFDFRIDKIEIFEDRGIQTSKAITSEGWIINFNFKGNLEEQIHNLSLVLKEKIKDRFDLSYIDLRFGNKVFYKYK